MIGDGSKIMMCDFFYGKLYCDNVANPHGFIKAADKKKIIAGCPSFEAFG